MSDYTPGDQPEQPQQPEQQQPRPQAIPMSSAYPSYTPPPRQKTQWWLLPVGIGCGCLISVIIPVILISILIAGVGSMGREGFDPSGSKVALIHVNGVIDSSSSDGIFSSENAGSEKLVDQLEKARKDNDVKAVVLRINSPGGSAAASEEIYNEILRVKERKPVYASMGDVAASGGYYIAAACNRIYANAATATGSIGVIMEAPNLSELFKKLGVDMQVVKSGKYKDMGNPARPMTPEEKQLIQGMIDNTYIQFVTAVSNGRKMPMNKVKSLATGQVYTGQQAKNLGLVDDIGGLRETILAAGKAGGISGEPKVAKYGKQGGLAALFDEKSATRQLTMRDYDVVADMVIRRLAGRGGNLGPIK
jgi:protease-4